MRPTTIRRAVGVVSVALALVVLTAGPATAATAWNVVTSPNRGNDFNRLDAVNATSASDVWAVGTGRSTPSSQLLTLTEHFNGSSWSLVPSPSVGSSTNELLAVDAASATDAWAVGRYYSGSVARTLALHWNGASWSVVPTPNVGTESNALQGVTVVSPTDVWAVGSSQPNAFAPLALHWNGASWSVVSTPTPPGGGFLNAVVAVAANNVWAVGGTGDDGDNALAEHWDGTRWRIMRSPAVNGEDELSAITAVSASDIWAVGHVGSSNLTEHWNGTAWRVVASPNVISTSNGNNFLTGVVALTSTDVWAVGGTINFTGGSLRQNSALHWNGVSWSVVATPDAGTGDNTLLGVTNTSAASLLVVGSYRPTLTAHDRTLILTASNA